MSRPDFEDFPRPLDDYYETRHDYLTQGDIFRDVPFSQMGPTLIYVDPPPEGLPVPDGHLPILHFAKFYPFAMLVSDTCDFRHPGAHDIERYPERFRAPNSVYQSGYLRLAPIVPIHVYDGLPNDPEVYNRIRQFDHFRRLMFMPAFVEDGGNRIVMPESVVVLHMTDLFSLDLVRALPRVTQLRRVARQQLDRKLAYFETGYQLPLDEFDPDME